MNNFTNNNKGISTPERKRKYVEYWLEDNCQKNLNEQKASRLFKIDEKLATPIEGSSSSASDRKHLASSTIPTSPVLGGKRLASSPLKDVHKNISKKLKIARKLNINLKTTQSLNLISQPIEEVKTKTNYEQKSKHLFLGQNTNVHLLETTKVSEFKEPSISFIPTDYSNNVNKNIIKPLKTENLQKETQIVEQVIESQFIESVSSEDKSTENTEIIVQETNSDSDSDKTQSDLIEEINSQLLFESTHKEKQITLSQNISNPSSDSFDSTVDIHSPESNSSTNDVTEQFLETLAFTPPVNNTRTLESKTDFNNIQSILQCTVNKQKKRKISKKGSLLDLLLTAITKERSNVNLFRHQLNRKPMDVPNKPFILLQVIENLPMLSDNQTLKCILIEDAMSLLNNQLQNNNFITIICVPEISGIIDVSHKPLLKVYEPWTIVDPNQVILYITRFIAIPSHKKGSCDIVNKNLIKKNVKIIYESHCPCLDQKALSNECKSKFQDIGPNVIKMVFSCNKN